MIQGEKGIATKSIDKKGNLWAYARLKFMWMVEVKWVKNNYETLTFL